MNLTNDTVRTSWSQPTGSVRYENETEPGAKQSRLSIIRPYSSANVDRILEHWRKESEKQVSEINLYGNVTF